MTTSEWNAAITVDLECRRNGVCLFVDADGRLSAFPKRKMTDALAAVVVANLSALHALLNMRGGKVR